MRQALKILGWSVGVLLALPIVLGALLLFVANVDWGRRLIEHASAQISGGQVVIAGHADAVSAASERAKALGAKRAIPLAVSAPFHCALMKPAEDRLAPELEALSTSNPRIPVVANVDAEPKRDARAAIEALIRQVSSPVRWEQVVKRLIAEGATTFIEMGPGTVLAGLIKKIDRSVQVMSIEDEQGLDAALAQLNAERA